MQRRVENTRQKETMNVKQKQNPFLRERKEVPENESSTIVSPPKPVSDKKPAPERKTPRIDPMFKNTEEIPIRGQRFVKPITEIVFTGLPMDSIGLHSHLVKTMADLLSITELTSVQQRAVPVALEGRDILVRSQTGSGKTLAYALPIVQQLQEIQPKINRTDGVFALIIVPTRELAIQTYELFVKLLKPFTWIVSTYITGGEKRKAEKSRLRKGINVLIGTPGRICDHLLHTETFKLDRVKFLVLDEADRLYEMGYEKDVKIIVDAINKTKPDSVAVPAAGDDKTHPTQTILLSATLTVSVQKLANLALKDPLYIDVSVKDNIDISKKIPKIQGSSQNDNSFNENLENAIENEMAVIPATVTQTYTLVPPKLRLVTLTGLLSNETFNKSSKILVFLGTEHLVDFHFDLLTEALTKKTVNSEVDNLDSDLEDEDDLLAKHLPGEDDDGEDEVPLSGVAFFK